MRFQVCLRRQEHCAATEAGRHSVVRPSPVPPAPSSHVRAAVGESNGPTEQGRAPRFGDHHHQHRDEALVVHSGFFGARRHERGDLVEQLILLSQKPFFCTAGFVGHLHGTLRCGCHVKPDTPSRTAEPHRGRRRQRRMPVLFGQRLTWGLVRSVHVGVARINRQRTEGLHRPRGHDHPNFCTT